MLTTETGSIKVNKPQRVKRHAGAKVRPDLKKKERTMKVRMLRTFDASTDGVNSSRLVAGESYNLPEDQAKRYLKKGLAEKDKAGKEPEETKAPENKKKKK
jgi:hypothetical protein